VAAADSAGMALLESREAAHAWLTLRKARAISALGNTVVSDGITMP